MSITASEMTPADISAVTNNGGNGWGMNDGSWILILFLFAIFGGWGGNGFGGGTGNGGFFPYYLANNTDNGVQAGFNNASIAGQLNGIQSAICNGFASAEQSASARQIADMQQSFANQTAMSQGFNSLASQFANCCCENRLASADLKYTIATENCADRYEAQQNARDIIENANRNNQMILDKLCSLELDAKNDRIADLERQLTMANLSASQTAQTAQLLADNSRQTAVLEDYLNPVPRPAFLVQNPNCCNQTASCGCGF